MLFGSLGKVIIGTKSSGQDNSEILSSGEVRDVKVYVTGLEVSPKRMCLLLAELGIYPQHSDHLELAIRDNWKTNACLPGAITLTSSA